MASSLYPPISLLTMLHLSSTASWSSASKSANGTTAFLQSLPQNASLHSVPQDIVIPLLLLQDHQLSHGVSLPNDYEAILSFIPGLCMVYGLGESVCWPVVSAQERLADLADYKLKDLGRCLIWKLIHLNLQ